MKKVIILIFLISASLLSSSQSLNTHMGIMLNLGTHIERYGLFIQNTLISNHWQTSLQFSFYHNTKTLGPQSPHWEAQSQINLMYAYGKININNNNLFNLNYLNKTRYNNVVGYGHTIYHNTVNTTQHTGTLYLGINKWTLIMENDMLGMTTSDQYRTGALHLSYRSNRILYAMHQVMWTGEKGKQIRNSNYPSRQGYRDMYHSRYGLYSHGIIYFNISLLMPYNQIFQIGAGVDADQIRHIIQNKFLHDVIFLPKKFSNKNNAHFPMISQDGKMYLFEKTQKIRKPIPYIQTQLNPSLFY